MVIQNKSELITGKEVRAACRTGLQAGPTSGLANGFLQTNVIILPEKDADEFEEFCVLNPRACPLIEKTNPGSYCPSLSAPKSDIRTDLPSYNIYKRDKPVKQTTNILEYWQKDFVVFLMGCSFSFEKALTDKGLTPRHQEEGKNVPMYRTNIPCTPSGKFKGNLVVSMRPYSMEDKKRISNITSQFPMAHGKPLYFGNGKELGIDDISKPNWGDPVSIFPNETPFFWACGVTSQAALENANLDFYISHTPGHMFLTDLKA